MKTRLSALALCLASLFGLHALQAADIDKAQLKQEAIGLVKQFGGTLKPQLKQAIQSGGPANAISVCSEKAPEIAQDLSQESGWKVKRVSLKPRGKNAMPDAWEQRVLEQFDQRQAAGESAKDMAYMELVDGRFRFMKAQGVESVCLGCHAAEVSAEVEAGLEKYYPDDKARGYTLGQVRGAFSLSLDL